jgi:hypothetical protein|tara:strand:+ start:260 stop:409 length:150 start_codon:yes stop_codon:yes gene_type:complete
VKVGDLVKYMSRTVLIVDIDEEWIHGIELGEDYIAKYKSFALESIDESR